MPAPATLVVFARLGRPASDAFMEGARVAGFRVVPQRPVWSRGDGTIYGAVGVVVDGLKGDNVAARDAYAALGVPVYVLELPRLRANSGSGIDAATRSVGLYKHTLHDLPAHVGNTAHVAGVIADRRADTVLVCGQKPGDSAHHMTASDCATWARETIATCQREYGMPVTYRPHPRAVLAGMDPAESYGAEFVSLPTNETIRGALSRAAALVSYNSTSGVDAIDAGVPVFYTAPAELVAYADYAAPLGDPIADLSADDRETCLLRFAAAQWTTDQLRDGTAARCLFGGADWPEARIEVLDADALAEREAESLALAAEFVNDAVNAGAYVRPAAPLEPDPAPAAPVVLAADDDAVEADAEPVADLAPKSKRVRRKRAA